MTTSPPGTGIGEQQIPAVIEVLSYLVTAARTQLDESPEYAPMRMLTAARRLGDALRPGAAQPLQELIDALDAVPETLTPRRDPDAYRLMVDDLCRDVADCLMALSRDGEDPARGAGAPA